MHLESFTINNYRKFRDKNNTIHFVKPATIDSKDKNNQSISVVASSTTLIIGKNNAGKTTIANSLRMLCNSEQPSASDFNLSYLNDLFKRYKKSFKENSTTKFELLETPQIHFKLKIKVDFNDKDLITHLAPFIPVSEVDYKKPVSVCIMVRISLTEEEIFKDEVKKILNTNESTNNKTTEQHQFEQFYALLTKKTSMLDIDGNLYQHTFTDLRGYKTEKFSLKKLINIKEIKANRHLKEGVLSSVFNKIVAFQFTNDGNARLNLESSIEAINNQISKNVFTKSGDISKVLGQL